MTHARNRPPTAPRGGRPSKGSRSVTSKDKQLLTDLRAAADHLRAKEAPELGDVVAGLLAPDGWVRLRKAFYADSIPPNMSISVNSEEKAWYQAAAKAAGRDLTTDVITGLRAFIDGEFSPVNYPRRSNDSSGNTTLNVRVSTDLRAEVKDAIEAREAEVGKTTIGHVVRAWLAHTYISSDTK
ncbi:hypothetical protein [Streptomyces zaomyceticus]|uniref:hypothetical protein n=1 Tax=Streptomyces zaomyceticus TaxID=68286 RepID=UPI0037B0AFB7